MSLAFQRILVIVLLSLFVYVGSAQIYSLVPVTYNVELGDINRTEEGIKRITKILRALDQADMNDTVYIHILSLGGDVGLALAVLNGMLTTKAHTITENRSLALSGAALVLMAGKEIRPGKFTAVMFHRARYSANKKLVPIDKPPVNSLERFVTIYVKPFLTEKEVAKYDKGEDIHLTGIELNKRLTQNMLEAVK